jgi:hypothetical protein
MPLNADDITAIVNLAHEYNDAVDRQDPHAWTPSQQCRPVSRSRRSGALSRRRVGPGSA